MLLSVQLSYRGTLAEPLVQTDQQTHSLSERFTRALVLCFCLSPVLVPLLAVGAVKWGSASQLVAALTSTAQAAAPDRREPDPFSAAVFAQPAHAPAPFIVAGETIVVQTPTVAGTHVLRKVMEREGLQMSASQLDADPAWSGPPRRRDRLDLVMPLHPDFSLEMPLRPSRSD